MVSSWSTFRHRGDDREDTLPVCERHEGVLDDVQVMVEEHGLVLFDTRLLDLLFLMEFDMIHVESEASETEYVFVSGLDTVPELAGVL